MRIARTQLQRTRDFVGIGFAVLLLSVIASSESQAVLPPDIEQQWIDEFLEQVDVRAEISFEVLRRKRIGARTLVPRKSMCQADYRIVLVHEQPDGLGLRSGDRIVLGYPCDRDGQWNWLGSTLPWAVARPENSLTLQIPSTYLESIGPNEWAIDNRGRVFAPIRPQAGRQVR